MLHYENVFLIPGLKRTLILLLSVAFAPCIFSQPAITSFAPVSGKIGSSVVITGLNFDPNPANNIVFFGGVKAAVITAASTSITVKVPAGAAYTPITVTTGGLTAYSSLPFSVKFDGGPAAYADNSLGATQFISLPDGGSGQTNLIDLDSDGKPDLVVPIRAPGNQVKIFLNTSSIGSISFTAAYEIPTLNFNLGLAVGDIDGDGKPDIITGDGNVGGDGITIYKNASTIGNILFVPTSITSFGTLPPSQIMLNDFNADGKTDILTLSVDDIALGTYAQGQINIFKNISSGGILDFQQSTPLPQSLYSRIFCCDFNLDGLPDFGYIEPNNYAVMIIKNNSTAGNISFCCTSYPITPGTGELTPTDLSAADVDSDGKPDLIVSYEQGFLGSPNAATSIHKNTSTIAALSFDPGIMTQSSFPLAATTRIATGDMDGDGKPDIITNLNGLSGFKNLGPAGTINFADRFGWSRALPGTASLMAADVDGDGKPDLVNGSVNIGIIRNQMGDVGLNCIGANTVIGSNFIGATYQWQVNTGSGYTNITNNATYNGATTDSLIILNPSSSWSGYQYRCLVDGNNGTVFTLQFQNSWTGTINSVWENPGNWSCGVVPDANTNVVITSGPVIVSANTTIRTLTISPGVVFTVAPGVTLIITH